jgi:hypothetical protein
VGWGLQRKPAVGIKVFIRLLVKVAMLKVLILFVAHSVLPSGVPTTPAPQFADCGCLCVDGVAKTLCQTVEEARLQPNVCPPRQQCPELPAQWPEQSSGLIDAPHKDARDCREVRIWDDAQGDYTSVKVCDVY